MIDISVGAVGAAIVAGLVSLLGLIIGKEQKVSEFRQAWIGELRTSFVNYLANINLICDAIRLQKAENKSADQTLLANYKALNEASNGIKLRINKKEKTSKKMLQSMIEFENTAISNNGFTPEKIRELEEKFIKASQDLLRFEWRRVKRGEGIFVWTKWIVTISLVILVVLLAYLVVYPPKVKDVNEIKTSIEVTKQSPSSKIITNDKARNRHLAQ